MDSRINFHIIRSKYQEENEIEKWVKLITEFNKGGWTSVEKVLRDLDVQNWTESPMTVCPSFQEIYNIYSI